MKRSLIALGVAASLALPVAAQANPKVYGKLNLSVEQFDKEFENPATAAEEYVRLQSNNSRFGVKGESELTATTSAVYQIEWLVNADSAGAAELTQRNRFLGLKHQDFGTVKLGAYDTYLKLAQGKVDLFNALSGDMKYVIAGENRVGNVVGYESPKFLDGLTINLMAQTQENAAGAAKESKNGNSASIVYDNADAGVYVALAMDNNINSATALNGTRESDNLRAVLSYKIADLTLVALYNTSEASVGTVGNEETGYTVGASYKFGDEAIKVQYGVAEHDLATAATQERTLLNVGFDHNFTSKTRGYVFYTAKEEDKLAALGDSEETTYGLGLEHNF